jgi:hypothetical protein
MVVLAQMSAIDEGIAQVLNQPLFATGTIRGHSFCAPKIVFRELQPTYRIESHAIAIWRHP